MSLLRLGDGKTLASILHAFSCLLSLREDSYYAVSYPVERPTWQGTEEDPPGNSQQGDLPTTA